ncbi:MAG TPA: GNAT family N-acetyltransferase [Chloroflexi bacterium]|nr:GNAT family N-acetyltransferase [Chloroflexota bacterium]
MRIRAAKAKDLETCLSLNHSYVTDHVWQMETRELNGTITVTFRVANLPREIRVDYPLRGSDMLAGWQRRDDFLIAQEDERICGYVTLTAELEHERALIGDLIVHRPLRRQGIGTMLLQAAAQWACDHDLKRLLINVQTKNYPAIRFCQSRGLSFCGYNDHYWPTQDIALAFGGNIR